MNVLVTGGAGFIGSHLCEALLDRGHRVTVLDSFDDFYDPAIKRKNIATVSGSAEFTLIEGDIRDEQAVERAIKEGQVDTVVHLAARAGVRPSIEQPVLYESVNVGGTAVLLEACHQHGIGRFIFASSSSVYGNNKKTPFSETDNVDFPISPYAATKKAAELLCHSYSHLYGMDISCMRFFTVYGPRQRPDLAIHKFTRLIEADEEIPVFGDGSMMRDYTFVSDTVEGVVRAMDKCKGFRIYNLGNNYPVSLSDLIGAIEKSLGKKAKINRLPNQPGDVVQTYADIDRARDELGYAPSTVLGDGLATFVRWFREMGN